MNGKEETFEEWERRWEMFKSWVNVSQYQNHGAEWWLSNAPEGGTR